MSHAAQRVAERRRVGEVAERDLHAHALGAQPARVAHQAAHRLAGRHEPAQQRAPDEPGGAGQQQHRRDSVRSGYSQALPRPTHIEETNGMAYVIAEPCIGTKDNSCVEVCPVDCIHPTPGRARLRHGRDALHRPRGVHRLRRLRRGLPGRRLLRRGPAARRVAELRRDQRAVLPGRASPPAASGGVGGRLARHAASPPHPPPPPASIAPRCWPLVAHGAGGLRDRQRLHGAERRAAGDRAATSTPTSTRSSG